MTLTSFVRVQIFVAFVDAVGIGLGAFIVGLFFGGMPLAIPIAVSCSSARSCRSSAPSSPGILAVFVALVYNGPVVAAVLMLAVVLAGPAARGPHPAAARHGQRGQGAPAGRRLRRPRGRRLAGIAGALFAVPSSPTLNAMVTTIASGRWRRLDSDRVLEATPKRAQHGQIQLLRRRRHKVGDDVPAPGVDSGPSAEEDHRQHQLSVHEFAAGAGSDDDGGVTDTSASPHTLTAIPTLADIEAARETSRASPASPRWRARSSSPRCSGRPCT